MAIIESANPREVTGLPGKLLAAGADEPKFRERTAPRGGTMKILRILTGRAALRGRSLKDGAKAPKTSAPSRGRGMWDEHGNILVEIGLSLPLLLLMFVGIFDFGIAYNNQLTLTQAVGSGAQYLQTIRTTTTNPCSDTLTAIENAAPMLTGSNISLALNLNGTNEPPSGTPTTSLSCSGAQSYLTAQTPVTVTATYPCSLPLVFTRGVTWVSSCSLSATVTEYEY
jgi:Flp pilus assembly protein TadG